jgi:crotonobetainyl-CoA:carnitine CoA-transferase CaiB-like acyl-CoA transferase
LACWQQETGSMKSFTPLSKIRVLDLSANLPGPFLTRILADLGAEIIKVEPVGGEGLRHMPPHKSGMGLAFGGLNAGKDSLAINLKQAEGVALVLELVKECDVLVEAFRPGKLAALGLGVDTLHSVKADLIICSITGYGQSGAKANEAGHDINFLAQSGIMALFGPANMAPQVPGVQISDVGAGSLQAAIGILAALMEREQSGNGRHLDISLARGSLAFGAVTFPSAEGQERGNGLLDGGAPCYRCYECADGRHVALGALEPRFFANFCNCAGRADLANKGFCWGEAARETMDELEALFKTRAAAEWVSLCEGHDTCLTLVRTPAEAMADPLFSPTVNKVGGFTVISADLGGPSEVPERPPSALGADAQQVMQRLQINGDVVQSAIESGALKWPEN